MEFKVTGDATVRVAEGKVAIETAETTVELSLPRPHLTPIGETPSQSVIRLDALYASKRLIEVKFGCMSAAIIAAFLACYCLMAGATGTNVVPLVLSGASAWLAMWAASVSDALMTQIDPDRSMKNSTPWYMRWVV